MKKGDPKRKRIRYSVATVDAYGNHEIQEKTFLLSHAIREAKIWLRLGTPVFIDMKWKKP